MTALVVVRQERGAAELDSSSSHESARCGENDIEIIWELDTFMLADMLV